MSIIMTMKQTTSMTVVMTLIIINMTMTIIMTPVSYRKETKHMTMFMTAMNKTKATNLT